MQESITAMRKSGLLLAFFAFVGVLLVSVSHLLTKDQIAENTRMMLQQNLNEVLDANRYVNDLSKDNVNLFAAETGFDREATLYLAKNQHGEPVAAIFRVTTLQGYSGAITLLVGVNYADEHITGVRVIEHKETPGLGDKIEVDKSDWIVDFRDKSLTNPAHASWAVKKDGGEFDQFTGATITPRAVVAMVEGVLIYAHNNMQRLFRESPTN